MNKEIWKDIEEYEGKYEVSNLGRVKSLAYIKTHSVNKKSRFIVKEKILKIRLNKYGYVKIILSKGNKKTFLVHRLVAKAFVKNVDNKPDINHLNGIKIDNRVENLEWVTKSENTIHAFKTGLLKGLKGEDNPASKLLEEDIIIIRKLRGIKPQPKIAKMFGISQSHVSDIQLNKVWQHIDGGVHN